MVQILGFVVIHVPHRQYSTRLTWVAMGVYRRTFCPLDPCYLLVTKRLRARQQLSEGALIVLLAREVTTFN